MEFCPPNISFFDVWVDHGTSECFMDTVSSAMLALFLLLFGGTQLWMYKKYSTRATNLRSSKLYYLQIFTSIALCLTVIVKYVLEATILQYKTLFIYQVSNFFSLKELGFRSNSAFGIYARSFNVGIPIEPSSTAIKEKRFFSHKYLQTNTIYLNGAGIVF